jgi:hypothetical protein
MDLKRCTGCRGEFPADTFNRRRNGRDGLSSRCRACTNKYARGVYSRNRLNELVRQGKWRRANRKYDKDRKAKWYRETRQERLDRMAAWRYRTRQAAIESLGGKCSCCGERTESMLDIDHINNDGAEHRSRAKGGNFSVYRDISATPDRTHYQVLCCNCNQSKRRNGGTCEHATQPIAYGWCAS